MKTSRLSLEDTKALARVLLLHTRWFWQISFLGMLLSKSTLFSSWKLGAMDLGRLGAPPPWLLPPEYVLKLPGHSSVSFWARETFHAGQVSRPLYGQIVTPVFGWCSRTPDPRSSGEPRRGCAGETLFYSCERQALVLGDVLKFTQRTWNSVFRLSCKLKNKKAFKWEGKQVFI